MQKSTDTTASDLQGHLSLENVTSRCNSFYTSKRKVFRCVIWPVEVHLHIFRPSIIIVIMGNHSITTGPPGGNLKVMPPEGLTNVNTMPAEEKTTTRMVDTRIKNILVDMMDCQFGKMLPLLF